MTNQSQVALINGAYGGMGTAIATRLQQQGFALALLGRQMDRLNQLKQQLLAADTNANIQCYSIDVRDEQALPEVAPAIVKHFKYIDVLINAVGIVPIGNLLEVNEQQWHEALATSLMSAVRLVTTFLPTLIKQNSGNVVLINGKLAQQPDANFVISSTITGAIRNFAKAISQQLATHNIRVNTINPGATATPLWDSVRSQLANKLDCSVDTLQQQIADNNPLGRIATVADIANAVSFLCSSAAEYINGTSITIDGGEISGA